MYPIVSACFPLHAPASFDKQLHLANLIGDLPWQFDMPTGTLSFGDRYRWHAQVLGTESHENNTWLWAWANEGSNIPDELLEAAYTMLELGEDQDIPEFLEPQFPLELADGHTLSLIASGVCDADAYYRGPYDGGAVFLLIFDDAFPAQQVEHPIAHVASVFPQAISALEIADHKLALAEYLRFYGIDSVEEGNRLVVKDGEKPILTATFDNLLRLTKLDATVSAK